MTPAAALAPSFQVPQAGASTPFRAACADDAAACAPLVFASGAREFGFFLGESDARCIAFLQQAFRSRHGRFSWRRHRVAVGADGTVHAVMAIHDGRRTTFTSYGSWRAFSACAARSASCCAGWCSKRRFRRPSVRRS